MNKKIFNISTELCVDIKTILRSEIIAKTGKSYQGLLTRNTEEHFTFTETVPQNDGRRNPHVFVGKYITVTRRDDGTYRLNFRPMPTGKGFTVEKYALGVFNEICMALEGLVEEE